MNTEITKQEDGRSVRGWIFYDAECGFCVGTRNRIGPVFEARGFQWRAIKSPIATEMLGLKPGEMPGEMKLRLANGNICGGVAAWAVLCRSVWWLWALGVLVKLPILSRLSNGLYRWIARNRYCLGGSCRLPRRTTRPAASIGKWIPLLLFPLLAIVFRSEAAPWVFMWLLAFAIYAGCKWLTYRDALADGAKASLRARLCYLLLWPGMSFKEFVGTPVTVSEPVRWLAPAAKTLAGAVLVWLAVPVIPGNAELLRGWVGMIGLIMMLHFGTLHLLALTLQAAGFNARPNMNAPLRARSLADFWGRRWNTGFNVLADRYGFRPLSPRVGPRAALVIVFLVSGLIHDLVIAFPAGGGYGLPTLYFAIQAAGMLLERAPVIRLRPWLNRLFTWVVLVAPLGCLFPPVFVRNVILPMLNAIGAN